MPDTILGTKKEYLTAPESRDRDMRDLRCPDCGYFQIEYKPHADNRLRRKCRSCKTMIQVIGFEVTTLR